MFVKLLSATLFGIEGKAVEIEVDTSPGLPVLNIVGLADVSIRESRERVRGCLKNAGFEYPLCRITVNLSPAGILKYGTQFDLGIALAVLCSSKQISIDYNFSVFLGELSLDGKIKGFRGALAMAIAAKESGVESIFVPFENAGEVSLIKDLKVYAVNNFAELVAALLKKDLSPLLYDGSSAGKNSALLLQSTTPTVDFSEIAGQAFAKRGMEIAAAGGHNVLLCGPPGSGKSMLASAFASIFPSLNTEEALEVIKLKSIAGEPLDPSRPFRAPHHSISLPAFIGGGWVLKPGEISLANKGILFMDEFAEFPRVILESLRQPLESQVICVSRLNNRFVLPADFVLVAAHNPCPCGFYGSEQAKCTCTAGQINSYNRKISGPILDRIDLKITLQPVSLLSFSESRSESSELIRGRVSAAVKIQQNRQEGLNARASRSVMERFFNFSKQAKSKVLEISEKLSLSARSYVRLQKICRTIADLQNEAEVSVEHVQEALQYKNG